MPDYLDVPIETDPDVLAADAFDDAQQRWPGWVPNAGNVETWLIESAARMGAESRDVASRVPTAIFRFLGQLFGILPLDASTAVADTTWTVRDDAGYTIPAGTQVGVRAAGDDLVAFEVVADVVVPPGDTATAAGGVAIAAVDAGAAASGLGSAGGTVELIDILDFVTGATLTGATTGGVDAEADSDYLDRLRGQFQLLAPRPILPDEFAVFAQNVAGVDRAIAFDGYNPADDTDGNERMVAVAAVDENGNAISAEVKAAVDADLQGRREVNFVVSVFDPTFTSIDVSFTVSVLDGYVGADVQAAAVAAVTDYLSPANWGLPATGDQRAWVDRPNVRYLELATLINNVEGVDEVTALTLGVTGDALAAADVALDGKAALPTVGTITGTVG